MLNAARALGDIDIIPVPHPCGTSLTNSPMDTKTYAVGTPTARTTIQTLTR